MKKWEKLKFVFALLPVSPCSQYNFFMWNIYDEKFSYFFIHNISIQTNMNFSFFLLRGGNENSISFNKQLWKSFSMVCWKKTFSSCGFISSWHEEFVTKWFLLKFLAINRNFIKISNLLHRVPTLWEKCEICLFVVSFFSERFVVLPRGILNCVFFMEF